MVDMAQEERELKQLDYVLRALFLHPLVEFKHIVKNIMEPVGQKEIILIQLDLGEDVVESKLQRYLFTGKVNLVFWQMLKLMMELHGQNQEVI